MKATHDAAGEGKTAESGRAMLKKEKVELADAHCHIDMARDRKMVGDAVRAGVLTMVTNGVSFSTNRRALEASDWKHVFPALGMDPENAISVGEEDFDAQVNAVIGQIRENGNRIAAIGEIGLDYKKASTFDMVAKQKTVFGKMLDLAAELKLPVSVHSRNAMDDVLAMLKERGMGEVHLHFFEGSVLQAKEAERGGYMISIPPLESNKRRGVIRDIAIDSIMAESDAPAVGASPAAVEFAVKMIADTKGMKFESVAEALTANTKRFFRLRNGLAHAHLTRT